MKRTDTSRYVQEKRTQTEIQKCQIWQIVLLWKKTIGGSFSYHRSKFYYDCSIGESKLSSFVQHALCKRQLPIRQE